MQEKQKEAQDLKRLLRTTRLTALDRKAIEARIEELSPSQRSEDRPQAPSPYLLGVFDRPKPSHETTLISGPQPQPRAAQLLLYPLDAMNRDWIGKLRRSCRSGTTKSAQKSQRSGSALCWTRARLSCLCKDMRLA